MDAEATADWVRSHASSILSEVELILEEILGDYEETEGDLKAALMRALEKAKGASLQLPEHTLKERFGLSDTELAILWLATAPFLDSSLRDPIARIHDSVLHDYVDPGLCLRLLFADRETRLAHLHLFSADAPLFRLGLLQARRRDLAPNDRMRHELVPADHLLATFSGDRQLSASLARYARREPVRETLSELHLDDDIEEAVEPLLQGLLAAPAASESFFARPSGAAILIHGAPGSGRSTSIRVLAARYARPLIVVDGDRLAAATPAAAEAALTTLMSEAELYGELILVARAGRLIEEKSPHGPALAHKLERHRVIVFFIATDNLVAHPALRSMLILRQGLSTQAELDVSEGVWRRNLPEDAQGLDIRGLANHIHLNRGQIARASFLGQVLAAQSEDGWTDALLERAARAQITSQVGRLAVISESTLSFEDIILDEDTQSQLEDILAAIQNRQRVLREWGLGSRIRRGTGISCLFDGEPGTGKTLSAEVISAEAGLNLMRVNVSGIVDKYIGETEKNLTRIFNQVRPDTNLLLFDEADSLFSKRTEVSRSTDRYSNMEINVLLQLIERYEGVTVLTTNLKRSIDPAFERRITFKINFPLPEPEERERIWLHLLPVTVPTCEEIDYEYLSTLELSGGEIKNSIVLAAYAAAREKSYIGMRHLMNAARREAAATGRLLRDEYSEDFEPFI